MNRVLFSCLILKDLMVEPVMLVQTRNTLRAPPKSVVDRALRLGNHSRPRHVPLLCLRYLSTLNLVVDAVVPSTVFV